MGNDVCYPFPIEDSSSDEAQDIENQSGNAMAFQINFPDVASKRNLWPHEAKHLVGFNEHVCAYVHEVDALARRLLPIAAKALGVQHDFFDDAFNGAEMLQGITIYPDGPRPRMGLGAHRDDGFFTLIAQSSKHGIELCLPGDRWRRPQLMPGTFLSI